MTLREKNKGREDRKRERYPQGKEKDKRSWEVQKKKGVST